MAKLDLAGYLEDDALELPGIKSKKHPAGKTYQVPSPDATTGLQLQAMADLGVKAHSGQSIDQADADRLNLDDGQELDLYRMLLGDTYEEMLADGVSWARIQKLGRYLFIHFTMGEEVAAAALANGGLTGEAAAPNRATRRRASKATATSSRGRGSTAGTTSRRRPAKKA